MSKFGLQTLLVYFNKKNVRKTGLYRLVRHRKKSKHSLKNYLLTSRMLNNYLKAFPASNKNHYNLSNDDIISEKLYICKMFINFPSIYWKRVGISCLSGRRSDFFLSRQRDNVRIQPSKFIHTFTLQSGSWQMYLDRKRQKENCNEAKRKSSEQWKLRQAPVLRKTILTVWVDVSAWAEKNARDFFVIVTKLKNNFLIFSIDFFSRDV